MSNRKSEVATYTCDIDTIEGALLISEIMAGVPSRDSLLLASALLFSVYGWEPKKVSKMGIDAVRRWVILAKKRMTWGDAYKLRVMLRDKKRPLWKRVLKIKS